MATTLLANPQAKAPFKPYSIPPEVQARRDYAERLGDRIARLSARLASGEYRLLVMIREFDEIEGWGGGFLSCAHWLNWRTGLSLGAAREKVRVARALAKLPQISEAMRQGKLSYSKVRALTRVATTENEGELMEFAKLGSAGHVERLVRAWRRVDRIEAAERDTKRRESRSLVCYVDEDGMLVVRGRLDPETGTVFLRALQAASDRLYEAGRRAKGDPRDSADFEHRRVDALALVAESALAADLDPGTRGDRYQVVVHVDGAVLQELEPGEPGRPGMSMLEDGVDVSAETSRRLACDSARITMTHDSDGNVLDVGRKTRTISPALRRALRFRDRTCRFPSCGITVCDSHHVRHWADGGETRLDNLLLLCRRHHVAVHEEGYRVELLPDGQARFFHPRGWEILAAPPPPDIDPDAESTAANRLEADGVHIDGRTISATCYNQRVDYAYALDVLRQDEWREVPPFGDVPAGTSTPGSAQPAQPALPAPPSLPPPSAERPVPPPSLPPPSPRERPPRPRPPP